MNVKRIGYIKRTKRHFMLKLTPIDQTATLTTAHNIGTAYQKPAVKPSAWGCAKDKGFYKATFKDTYKRGMK